MHFLKKGFYNLKTKIFIFKEDKLEVQIGKNGGIKGKDWRRSGKEWRHKGEGLEAKWERKRVFAF